VLGVLSVPVLVFVAFATLVGLRMRGAAAAARRFCADHPVGATLEADTQRRRREAEGLRVRVVRLEAGRGEVEACGGVMTATYCCTLTLEAGRVASQRYARID